MNNTFKNIGGLFKNKKTICRICSLIKEKSNGSLLASTSYFCGGMLVWMMLNGTSVNYKFNEFTNSWKVKCFPKVSDHNATSSVKRNKHNNALEDIVKNNYLSNLANSVSIVGNQGPDRNMVLKGCQNSPKISISAIQVNANNPIEDRMIIQRMNIKINDKINEEFVLSAVIDGHGGWQVAEYVQKNFVNVFKDELNKTVELLKKNGVNDTVSELDVKTAIFYSLKNTYARLDEELRNILEIPYNLGFSKLASVGACVTVSIITEDAILTANSGDCLSVYCDESGMYIPMNEQLSAMNPVEQKRLEEEHIHDKDNLIQCKEVLQGKYLMGLYSLPIYKSCYVKGILQPSRAIGDFRLKHMDFNYNWEKDMSSDKLMNTFSHLLGDQSERKEHSPYSYELVNGDNSVTLKKDEKRYYVKNPLSFPYVKSEPMLHIYYYNSKKKEILSSKLTDVETNSNQIILTPNYIKDGKKLSVEYITPEYKYPNISECNGSAEFIKDYICSKLKNISSYIQGNMGNSKKSFLVLGTDGVWDFLRPKDVSNIILKSNSIQTGVENIVKNVLQNAGIENMDKLKSLSKKRKVFDDTSVILIEINSE